MNDQVGIQVNNNERRFRNPFNLDPDKQDICIEKKLDRDIFCPILSLVSNFGEENEYYSMRTVQPLKESFFHSMQALIFPNASLLQFSMIMCYVIIVLFIISLCFGLDETNLKIFLEVKLSTVDTIGSFYPKKIKKNSLELYRLLTFHFLHYNFSHLTYNVISLVSYCTFFELLVKKHIFILIFFLTGIFSSITAISFFKENERFCGMNNDINGILGAFVMLFIMNWGESKVIFTPIGRFFTIYLLCVFIFFNTLLFDISVFANISLHMISLFYGAFFFAIIAKPIKPEKWKLIVRIFSALFILTMSSVSLISFYLKE